MEGDRNLHCSLQNDGEDVQYCRLSDEMSNLPPYAVAASVACVFYLMLLLILSQRSQKRLVLWTRILSSLTLISLFTLATMNPRRTTAYIFGQIEARILSLSVPLYQFTDAASRMTLEKLGKDFTRLQPGQSMSYCGHSMITRLGHFTEGVDRSKSTIPETFSCVSMSSKDQAKFMIRVIMTDKVLCENSVDFKLSEFQKSTISRSFSWPNNADYRAGGAFEANQK